MLPLLTWIRDAVAAERKLFLPPWRSSSSKTRTPSTTSFKSLRQTSSVQDLARRGNTTATDMTILAWIKAEKPDRHLFDTIKQLSSPAFVMGIKAASGAAALKVMETVPENATTDNSTNERPPSSAGIDGKHTVVSLSAPLQLLEVMAVEGGDLSNSASTESGTIDQPIRKRRADAQPEDCLRLVKKIAPSPYILETSATPARYDGESPHSKRTGKADLQKCCTTSAKHGLDIDGIGEGTSKRRCTGL